MVGVILYTLLELMNFYLAYKCVFGVRFTKKRWPYVMVIAGACVVQIAVRYLVDDTWRDIVAVAVGLVGAIVLTERKKWKTILLYPIVFFLSSFINVLGSYGVAALLMITQEVVGDSLILTLVSECTAIIIFLFYNVIIKKKKSEEMSFSIGQYVILLVGGVCFFAIVGFSQGVLRDEFYTINKMKELFAVSCVVIALFFIILNIWQQVTWKRAMQYQMDNEKYEIYLNGQEEYIRMLIIEDEKRRKLRHDMNAHMLALDTMVDKEEWDTLREYLGQMKESLEETSVNKYTSISAVDAIVDKWYRKALEYDVKWKWDGKFQATDRISVFDLCTIFSNLLSNAVEAIERVDGDRRIEVKISDYQEKLVISIGNTCGTVLEQQGRFGTFKEDKLFHGLGIKNIEEIVNKHGGSIDFDIKSGWFQVEIVV